MLGRNGGVIWDLTSGQMTKFQRGPDGVYELNLWIRDSGPAQGFTRPGQ